MSSGPFEIGVRFVLDREGGFVNHPDDPGGATNYGITLRVMQGLPDGDLDGDGDIDIDDVRLLTPERARIYYKARVWDALQLDALPGPVAVALFDAAVNCGTRRAVTWLQRVGNAAGLALVCDGILGPISRQQLTKLCLRAYGDERLANAHIWERQAYYNDLASQARFRTFHLGWTRRTTELSALVRTDM
jgi:lysozyme family protein